MGSGRVQVGRVASLFTPMNASLWLGGGDLSDGKEAGSFRPQSFSSLAVRLCTVNSLSCLQLHVGAMRCSRPVQAAGACSPPHVHPGHDEA